MSVVPIAINTKISEKGVQGAQPLAGGSGVSPAPLAGGSGVSPAILPLFMIQISEKGVQGAQPLAGGSGVSPAILPLFMH